MVKTVGLGLAFMLMCSTAAAERYLCKLNIRNGGFVQSTFAIDLRADGSAVVIDTFVAELEKKPKILEAKRNRTVEFEVRRTV